MQSALFDPTLMRTACPCCAGDQLESRGSFLACTACGSLATKELSKEEDIRAHHAPNVYHYPDRSRFPRFLEWLISGFRQSRSRWLRRHLSGSARILDVGCGRGLMAIDLKKRGFVVQVTELSPAHIGSGVKDVGISPYFGLHVPVDLAAHHFDAICFFHTLEHMENPREQLRRAAASLAKNGEIFLEIPLLSNWARLFVPDWFHTDYPRHLFLPTAKGFRALIRKANLRIVEAKTFSLEFSAASLFFTLSNRLWTGKPLFEAIQDRTKSSWKTAILLSMILFGTSLLFLPSVLLWTFGQGDILRVRLALDGEEG